MKIGAACQWPPNARFWVWECDGWVKLTVKPGETLKHYSGGPCEEGFHYEMTAWEYDKDFGEDAPQIVRHFTSESRDCDGPLEHHSVSACPIGRLREERWAPADDEILTPDWQKVESWQRDHYAEAMGY